MAHLVERLPDHPVSLWSPSIHAHLVVGEISAGFFDEDGRIAVYSDEDVFGLDLGEDIEAEVAELLGEDQPRDDDPQH